MTSAGRKQSSSNSSLDEYSGHINNMNNNHRYAAATPDGIATSWMATSTSPAQKVRYILVDGEDKLNDVAPPLVTHPLFTQLDVLVHFDNGKTGWKEMARWLKYQETVEVGDRWSKPHVPTTSMHALFELRRFFSEGKCAVGLDVSAAEGPYQVGEAVVDTLKSDMKLSDDVTRQILEVILQPHKHKHRASSKKHAGDDKAHKSKESKHLLRRRSGDDTEIATVYFNYPKGANPNNLEPYKPNKKLQKKIPKTAEVANILVGQVSFLTEPVMAFCRMQTPTCMADLTEVEIPTRFVFLMLTPEKTSNIWDYTEMGRAMATLLNDKIFCDLAYKAKSRQDIVDGMDEFMDGLTVLPPSIWDPSTRLAPPNSTVSEDKIRRRLVDSQRKPAGPTAPPQEEGASEDMSLLRTGRFCGGLIHDVKSRYSLYWSDIRDGLHIQCVASTIFLFFACITPIVTFGGLMGQETHGLMGTMETLMSGAICGVVYALFAGQPLTIIGATGPLLVFESILCHMCTDNGIDFMALRFWVGMWVMFGLFIIVAFDLSALVRYITRFTEESFSILISAIFIYEAFTKVIAINNKSPIHTGVTREEPGFLCYCSMTSSSAFNLDSPATGDSDFLFTTARLWAGSILDEISEQEAVNGVNATEFNATTPGPVVPGIEACITHLGRINVRKDCISEKQCLAYNWTLSGPACGIHHVTGAVPDVFLLSIILFLGTFALAMFFRIMRTSRYCPAIVRNMFADFAVFLSVCIWTGIDIGFGLPTPKLNVPAEFKTTIPERGWLVNPANLTWWLGIVAILPAILATILVFLDQQITAVIVNRREHKMKKPHGYHLDLLVIAVLVGVCSTLGLPWFVAATVRAITHVKSLFKESETRAPGERPQMLGCREQRVTGVCIHLLIGFSTLLTSVLRLIPMPVLYGVFMYMGLTSLTGVQFIDRIKILAMPTKYQPDYIFLRHVRTFRVHIFTLIQLICSALMWIIKSVKITSIAFPLMLVALMTVRKLMDFVFTQSELYWLDHLLPEEHRRQKEDEAHRLEDGGQDPKKSAHLQTTILDGQNDKDRTEQSILLMEKQNAGTTPIYRPNRQAADTK